MGKQLLERKTCKMVRGRINTANENIQKNKFDFILTKINDQIEKISANLKPESIPKNVQLVITVYHMGTFIQQ